MKYILSQISFAALVPVAVITFSFCLLMHSNAWATPMFVVGLGSGVVGMWFEARGWEMLFEFITGHFPKLPKKDQ